VIGEGVRIPTGKVSLPTKFRMLAITIAEDLMG